MTRPYCRPVLARSLTCSSLARPRPVVEPGPTKRVLATTDWALGSGATQLSNTEPTATSQDQDVCTDISLSWNV